MSKGSYVGFYANGINCSHCSQSLQDPLRKIVLACVGSLSKRWLCVLPITAHRGKMALLGSPSEQVAFSRGRKPLQPR